MISKMVNLKEMVLIENFGHLAVDRDNDNLITIQDFLISSRINGIREDVARSAFRLYDKNKNGYLDNTELTNVNAKFTRLYFENHKVNFSNKRRVNVNTLNDSLIKKC